MPLLPKSDYQAMYTAKPDTYVHLILWKKPYFEANTKK